MSKLKKFIVDKNGQWAHPGQPTMIPDTNGRITMQGVPYPVYGVDDQGNAMMMMPGQEYQFPGNHVYETPMAQMGGDPSIPDLSNKGWLSKYQDGAQVGPRLSNVPVPNVGPIPNLGPTAEQRKIQEEAHKVYEKANPKKEKAVAKTMSAAELRHIEDDLRRIDKPVAIAESTDTSSVTKSIEVQKKSFEQLKEKKPNLKSNKATMPDFSSSISSYQDPEEKARREKAAAYYKNYKPETTAEVKQIQQQLVAEGYLDNTKKADGSFKEIDGKFGDRTKAAYEKYLNKEFSKKGPDLSNELTRTDCGLEGCAEYVSSVTKPYGWALGDAWTMNDYINNHGGKTKYNIYTDPAFRNVTTSEQLKKVTRDVKSKNKASADMFQVGDVVGLFYPPSSHHQEALDNGKGTYNTHVGVVTAIKDGVPIVSHNIHGTLHHDAYNSLNVGWVSSPTSSDKVYKPSQNAETLEDKINVYSKDLTGVFAPDMNSDDVAHIVKGILTKETNLGKTRANEGVREAVRGAMGKSTDPSDISRGVGKLKTATLPSDVKGFLQIPDNGELSDDAGVKGAVYKYIEGYKFFDNYRKKNPDLKLTDEDIKNMAILSYNQGYNKLSNLGYNKATMTPQEEVDKLRELYNGNVKDVSSTNYKYLGEDLGNLLYDMEYPEGHPSYIKKVNEYSKRKEGGWLTKYQYGNQAPSKYDLMQMDRPTAVAESTSRNIPKIKNAPKQVESVKQEASRVKQVMKETGAKSPAKVYAQEKEQAKLDEIAANQQSTLSPAPERGVSDYVKYAWDVASNPMTAARYKVMGQEIPWNFTKSGERNVLDMPLDIVNPAFYINTAGRLGKAAADYDTYTDVGKTLWAGAKTLSGDVVYPSEKEAVGNTLGLAMDAMIFAPGVATMAKYARPLGELATTRTPHHWWKGYSKVDTPKQLPGSPSVTDDLVDLWRIQERGQRPMSELAAEGKLGRMFQNERSIKHFKDREKHFGQWFTKDKSDLDWYKNDREFVDPEVISLKVPKSKLEQYSQYDKTLSRAPDREFVIPFEEQELYKELPGSSNVDSELEAIRKILRKNVTMPMQINPAAEPGPWPNRFLNLGDDKMVIGQMEPGRTSKENLDTLLPGNLPIKTPSQLPGVNGTKPYQQKHGGWIFKYQEGGSNFKTKLSSEDEEKFQAFFKTLPNNLRQDDNSYDIRGYWDALDKPKDFDYSQPTEEDGYYHAFSRHPYTGKILKSPVHPTFKMAVSEQQFPPYAGTYVPMVGVDGNVYMNDVENAYQKGGSTTKNQYINNVPLKPSSWLNKYQ